MVVLRCHGFESLVATDEFVRRGCGNQHVECTPGAGEASSAHLGECGDLSLHTCD